MTDDITTNDNTQEDLKALLNDPKFANMADDEDIPDELLEKLSGEQLTAVFVEQLMADKGVEPTDELRAELTDEINMRVSREVVSNLPDYMVDQLENKMADGEADDEALNKMIEESGIDVETITENAMVGFRNEYLNGNSVESVEADGKEDA